MLEMLPTAYCIAGILKTWICLAPSKPNRVVLVFNVPSNMLPSTSSDAAPSQDTPYGDESL